VETGGGTVGVLASVENSTTASLSSIARFTSLLLSCATDGGRSLVARAAGGLGATGGDGRARSFCTDTPSSDSYGM